MEQLQELAAGTALKIPVTLSTEAIYGGCEPNSLSGGRQAPDDERARA